ncbi:MAG: ATP-dependent helicase [Thiotrichaceae bacterium]|nr:ATP-dependent helicase [Thiotrichaceae bacterium]
MVSEVSEVEQKIFECIDGKKHFVLDAGAGSGKTLTLIKTLNYVIKHHGSCLLKNNQKIVCITYTNVAKDEIIKRTEHNNLIVVSTIHDFLWDSIKQFQTELRKILLVWINEKLVSTIEKAKKPKTTSKKYKQYVEDIEKYQADIESISSNKPQITYKSHPNYSKGIFTHDDLIVIANKMFLSHKKLCRLSTMLYPFIFVDEYQDTQKETIDILLNQLNSESGFVVGFFGDKWQQIYDGGIGEIPIEHNLIRIEKTENYRSSPQVITLLNNIRTDIKQVAMNSSAVDSSVTFHFYPTETFNVQKLIVDTLLEKWNVQQDKINKLYLTHRMIARENECSDIYDAHNEYGNDSLTDNKNNRGWSPYTDFLFDIRELFQLYLDNRIQDFLSKISYEITSIDSKKRLRSIMDEALEIKLHGNIKDIIDFFTEKNLLIPSEKMTNFDLEKPEKKKFYDKLMPIKYSQFEKYHEIYQNTFSTQHGTKGDEFDNVLIIIDDRSWKNYNFNQYFSGEKSTEACYIRTRNLFYVICSRAKKNLAVLCVSPLSDPAQNTLKQWFGEGNYYIE